MSFDTSILTQTLTKLDDQERAAIKWTLAQWRSELERAELSDRYHVRRVAHIELLDALRTVAGERR